MRPAECNFLGLEPILAGARPTMLYPKRHDNSPRYIGGLYFDQESLKVQMGLLEAREESSRRKLEADLNAEMEKQVCKCESATASLFLSITPGFTFTL